jgi:hypothetical protein
MKSRILVLALTSFLIISVLPLTGVQAKASSPSPKITWDCQLMRLSDEDGPFVFFDPRAQVVWYGKKLKYQALYWTSQDTRLSQAGQRYGTVTASRGGKSVSKLDLREKFYYENETEYKKIQLNVTDSRGKKSKQICIWEGPVANGW